MVLSVCMESLSSLAKTVVPARFSVGRGYRTQTAGVWRTQRLHSTSSCDDPPRGSQQKDKISQPKPEQVGSPTSNTSGIQAILARAERTPGTDSRTCSDLQRQVVSGDQPDARIANGGADTI